MINHQ